VKAIIVDMHEKYVIVATRSGDFKKVYNRYQGCCVGDEINVVEKPFSALVHLTPFIRIRTAAVAVVIFMLLSLGGYGIYDYTRAVAFVTLDINPSIELSINRYERVIDIRGLNTDGSNIVSKSRPVKNLRVEDALKVLLEEAVSEDYLDTGSSTVLLTVSGKQKIEPDNFKAKIRDAAESQLESMAAENSEKEEMGIAGAQSISSNKHVMVIVKTTTPQKHSEAKKMNMSQGKLLLYDKLKKVKPDVTLDDVKKASVSQVIEQMTALSPDEIEKWVKVSDKIDKKNNLEVKKENKDNKDVLKQLKQKQKDAEKKAIKERQNPRNKKIPEKSQNQKDYQRLKENQKNNAKDKLKKGEGKPRQIKKSRPKKLK
jgi:hypothetical protein